MTAAIHNLLNLFDPQKQLIHAHDTVITDLRATADELAIAGAMFNGRRGLEDIMVTEIHLTIAVLSVDEDFTDYPDKPAGEAVEIHARTVAGGSHPILS